MASGNRNLPWSRPKKQAKAGAKKKPPPKTPARYLGIYDEAKPGYWSHNVAGELVWNSERQFSRWLRAHGFAKNVECDNGLSQLENELLRVQRENSVHWAGELAGYDQGRVTIDGNRCLITRSRNKILPAKGDYPHLRQFLAQLLGDAEFYWRYWIRCSLLALAAGPPWRPGQAMALAGPSGCGKSLTQDIMTEIFGGRSGKPFAYMMGDTSFNRNLFRAEHLVLEDEVSETDRRARRKFAAKFKGFVANQNQACHPKNIDMLQLTPFWRISFTLNDEPDYLTVLPPMDPSIKDKIFLLRCSKTVLPFDDDDLKARGNFRAAISKELPAFLHDCLAMKIAPSDRDQRYGCKSFQDPALTDKLSILEEEDKLLELIDYLRPWSFDNAIWQGSAAELDRCLREKDTAGEVARLFTWPTACGTFLARLESKYPERIKRVRGHENRHLWEIYRPAANGQAAFSNPTKEPVP